MIEGLIVLTGFLSLANMAMKKCIKSHSVVIKKVLNVIWWNTAEGRQSFKSDQPKNIFRDLHLFFHHK